MTADGATPSYRDEFGDRARVEQYDATQYAAGSWSTLLWELEQDVLADLLDRRSFVPRRERYLDFACGTGRVTGFVAGQFQQAVGLDISDAMLDQARAKVPAATFVQADVRTDPEAAGSDFDLVTAFRFVLNANPDDRLPALQWVRSRMRDGQSRAIVNNHGNLWTHKALTHGVRRVLGRGSATTGNVLSAAAMRALVREAGFSVESVHGLGHLGGQAMRLVPVERMRRVQAALAGRPGVQRLGEDQIYVLSPS